MKFTFLGTAAAEGWPAVFCNCESCKRARTLGGADIRTRSQSLIDDDLMVDFPADTYMHVLQNGLDLSAVKIFLITHNHQDHFYPEEFGMRGGAFSHQHTEETITIVASADVIRTFHRACDGIIDQERLSHITLLPIRNFETVALSGYRITALAADHAPDQEAHMYLIEKDGKTILYGHDTGYFPEETWCYLKEHPVHLDFVTLDCCFCLMHSDRGHMGLDTCVRVRDRLQEYGLINAQTKVFVNHFSHNGNVSHETMVQAASQHGMEVSYDSLSVAF